MTKTIASLVAAVLTTAATAAFAQQSAAPAMAEPSASENAVRHGTMGVVTFRGTAPEQTPSDRPSAPQTNSIKPADPAVAGVTANSAKPAEAAVAGSQPDDKTARHGAMGAAALRGTAPTPR